MTADILPRVSLAIAAIVSICCVHPCASGQEAAPTAPPFAARFRTQVEQLAKRLEIPARHSADYPDLWAVRKGAESFGMPQPEDAKLLLEKVRAAKPRLERDVEEIEAELAIFILARALPAKEAEACFRKLASEQSLPSVANLGMALVDMQAALKLSLEQVEKAHPDERIAWYKEVSGLIAICGNQKDLDALNKLVPRFEPRVEVVAPVLRYRESLSEKDRVLLTQQETILWINRYNGLWTRPYHPPADYSPELYAYFVCKHHKFASHLLRDRLHDPVAVWILFYQEGKECRAAVEKLLGEMEAGRFQRKSPYGFDGDAFGVGRDILSVLDKK